MYKQFSLCAKTSSNYPYISIVFLFMTLSWQLPIHYYIMKIYSISVHMCCSNTNTPKYILGSVGNCRVSKKKKASQKNCLAMENFRPLLPFHLKHY